ncbi:hypothetical protein [Bradyrhizobium sp. USDA 3364]
MGYVDIEGWSFTSAEAAEIVGLFSDAELANYLKRYNPFPHKMRGRGRPTHFQLRDLMLLRAAGSLIKNVGMPPKAAFAALAPYAGPYGAMLHDRAGTSFYPGTMTLTFHGSRWVGADSPHEETAIQIRAWPIFDHVFPRMKKMMISAAGSARADVEKAVAEYEEKITSLREERWQ